MANNGSLGSDCSDSLLFTADYSDLSKTVWNSGSFVDMFNVRTEFKVQDNDIESSTW